MDNVINWTTEAAYLSNVGSAVVQEAERLLHQERFLQAMSSIHHTEESMSSSSGSNSTSMSGFSGSLSGSSIVRDPRERNSTICLSNCGCPELTSDTSVSSSNSWNSDFGPLFENPSGSDTTSGHPEPEQHQLFVRKRAAMRKGEWFGPKRTFINEGEWFAGLRIPMAAFKKVHFGALPSAGLPCSNREWFASKRAAMAKSEQLSSLDVSCMSIRSGHLPPPRYTDSGREWVANKKAALANRKQLSRYAAMVCSGHADPAGLPDSCREWSVKKRAVMAKSERCASRNASTDVVSEVDFGLLPSARHPETGRGWFFEKRTAMAKSEQLASENATTVKALTKIRCEPLLPARPSSFSPGRGALTSSPDSEPISPHELFHSAAARLRASLQQLLASDVLEVPWEGVKLFHAAAARLRACGGT